ncbi:NADP oxidoreductase coenzyme F420-dependent [archaeon BMS3Abin16]|nr:NADP oxidoreductase coenzyme F420-dependent [archaeon BMS3Abin16]
MIGFIGGTGNQGRALAYRLAANGEKVILGSRTLEKAEKIVAQFTGGSEKASLSAGTNEEAAEQGEIVFITLPYKSMKTTLEPLKERLRGKIVVDVINPLTNNNTHKGMSASEELQLLLPKSRVVCAFKNVSSHLIGKVGEELDVDSIVCSDDEEAKQKVIELSEKIGIPSIDGGRLENALASELLTRLLLHLNKEKNAETGFKIQYYKV